MAAPWGAPGRVGDRATTATLGSLLMICVVVLVSTTLAVGVLTMADLGRVASHAENVLTCGRVRC